MGIFVGLSVEAQPFQNLLAALKQPVDSEKLHLTLAHYGNCHEEVEVCRAASTVAQSTSPFDITYGGIGRFRYVSWVGVADRKPLASLRQSLLGVLPEAGAFRDFIPHVTVCKGRLSDNSLKDVTRVSYETRVRELTVFSSTNGHQTILAQYPLRGEAQGELF